VERRSYQPARTSTRPRLANFFTGCWPPLPSSRAQTSPPKSPKACEEKPKKGGTPHRAPIGYLNFSRQTSSANDRGVCRHPRSIRTEAQRSSEHFSSTHRAYYTLDQLVSTLAHDGLTRIGPRVVIPKQPLSRFHRRTGCCHNRYYIGLVEYAGAVYEGRHEPLAIGQFGTKSSRCSATHASSGEKQRLNNHYLEGAAIYAGGAGVGSS